MSAEKAQLRAAAIHDVGLQLNEMLEGSQQASYRAEGAETAFGDAAKLVAQLHGAVDREIEAGTLDLERAALVKQWVTRGVLALERCAAQAQQQRVAQRGHTVGLSAAVQLLRSQQIQELRIADEHRARETAVEDDHPIKEQRLAEEALERASQPPEAPQSVPPSNGSTRPPRRRRKAAEGHGADA